MTELFIIRDLDKDPHEITVPLKILDPLTPKQTPNGSPDPQGMARSTSNLSSWSNTSDDERSTSSLSLRSAAFPFSIFKWKKPTTNNTGLQSPPPEHDLEEQLQEERRLRHIAEDRLSAVEEEVSRICTIMLPTDTSESGEAYFSSVLSSVRMAIDSYESRRTQLERDLATASAMLTAERRERTEMDIEVKIQAQVGGQDELLQRIKDTECQRDALRHISSGLKQRLTIETRKNAEKVRALERLNRVIMQARKRPTIEQRPPLERFVTARESYPGE